MKFDVPPDADLSKLTPLRRRIVELRVAGLTAAQIGTRLGTTTKAIFAALWSVKKLLGMPIAKRRRAPPDHRRCTRCGSNDHDVRHCQNTEWTPPPPEPAPDVPASALTRKLTIRRDGSAKARVVSGKLKRIEKQAAAAIETPPDSGLPATRGECQGGPRPCPLVSCRWHLYLDVTEFGGIKLNFPHLEVWELEESCALDVADRDGVTLEQVGRFMNVSRERIRQIEEKAQRRARAAKEILDRGPVKIRKAG